MATAFAALMLAAGVLAACGGGENSSAAAGTALPAGPASATAAGTNVFAQNCSTCHTLKEANASGQVGPNLDDLRPDEDRVKRQVTNGGGGMPAFGGTLSDAEIDAVAKYVSSNAGK